MNSLHAFHNCAHRVDRAGLPSMVIVFFAHHFQAIGCVGRSWGDEDLPIVFPRVFILRPLEGWASLQQIWPTLVGETEVRYA